MIPKLITALLLPGIFCLSTTATFATTYWVVGKLSTPEMNMNYAKTTVKLTKCYKRSYKDLTTIRESDLNTLSPQDTYIYAGPIEAFRNLSRLGLPLEVLSPQAVKIDGKKLALQNVGFFLKNKTGTRQLFSGTSWKGFQDVWKVPTGRNHCTITRYRSILWEGNYKNRHLNLPVIPFLPLFPSKDKLLAKVPSAPESALRIMPVCEGSSLNVGKLRPRFLTWLDEKLEGKRALFIGENHWSVTQAQLFIRLLFHVASTKGPCCVILEQAYSASAYFDHFVNIENSKKAKTFYKKSVATFVAYRATRQILESIRRWNRKHKNAIIRVGCLDLEWSRASTVEHILLPYLRKIDPSLDIPHTVFKDKNAYRKLHPILDKLLTLAEKKNLVGEYPFLTSAYIRKVLTNFRDTLLLDWKKFAPMRQKSIVRNLAKYNDEKIGKNFLICKGGSYHANKKAPVANQEMRDAAYLEHVYPKTRGKVLTLATLVLGYSFKQVSDLDTDKYKSGANNYKNFVTSFQRELQTGHAQNEAFYIFEHIKPLDRAIMRKGVETNGNIFAVSHIDPKAIETIYGKQHRGTTSDFDATIVILKSMLDRTLPKNP